MDILTKNAPEVVPKCLVFVWCFQQTIFSGLPAAGAQTDCQKGFNLESDPRLVSSHLKM